MRPPCLRPRKIEDFDDHTRPGEGRLLRAPKNLAFRRPKRANHVMLDFEEGRPAPPTDAATLRTPEFHDGVLLSVERPVGVM